MKEKQTNIFPIMDFYKKHLGRAVCSVIKQEINIKWEDKKSPILGVGFADCFIDDFLRPTSAKLTCFNNYLSKSNVRNLIIKEDKNIPVASCVFDKVVVAHALENSDNINLLIREIWRVTEDNGEVVFIVPNRWGLWANFENNPFGIGRPFSPYQLKNIIGENLFEIEYSTTRLFFLPKNNKMILNFLNIWERLGQKIFPALGGILIVKARKRVYAPALKQDVIKQSKYIAVTDAFSRDNSKNKI